MTAAAPCLPRDRGRPVRNLVVGACVAALLAACHRTGPPRDTSEPLFLNAAPQDHALYLTWNTAPTGGEVTVHCRRADGGPWSAVEAGSSRYTFFDGLENDVDYECFATRRVGRATINSRPITQTPRARPPRVGTSYFTNQHAADQWLRNRHISPQSLFLRGQPLTAWDARAPDGVYTDARGKLLFILLRQADNGFRAPIAPRPPGEVRTVLKHALWPTDNPFDQPERFAMPITPIEPPIIGQVTRYASASSFSIAYHPQLSSRCTRFMPENPTPGRIAIHVYGHDLRRSACAATIDALLDRGWQVIAVDMPLLGANGADQRETLKDHNSFMRWSTDGVSPMALFLQPLKAIVDQIYRENGANPDLTVMLVGRSGGGWTSFMYAALDERVHYAVSVAGGVPMSQWGHDKPLRTADYEQLDPLIYESVRYEDIMPVAGSRGAFYVYNEHDPCCFRLAPDDPFLRYLQSAAVALHKPIGVYVDRETMHSFSEAAVDAMDTFIAATDATQGIPAPTATPTGDDSGS